MEHIVQFGISIDDERIKKTVEEKAVSQICNSFRDDAIKVLVGSKDRYDYNCKVKEFVTAATAEFLEKYKDEIIEDTSKKLAERLSKTKAVKNMVESTLNTLLE
jgi:trehalose-6-phosphate synthase